MEYFIKLILQPSGGGKSRSPGPGGIPNRVGGTPELPIFAQPKCSMKKSAECLGSLNRFLGSFFPGVVDELKALGGGDGVLGGGRTNLPQMNFNRGKRDLSDVGRMLASRRYQAPRVERHSRKKRSTEVGPSEVSSKESLIDNKKGMSPRTKAGQYKPRDFQR